MKLDFADIAIHCGISLLATIILLLMGVWWPLVLAISFNGWLCREIWQHADDPTEVLTRTQSLLEWVLPVVTTGVVILLDTFLITV